MQKVLRNKDKGNFFVRYIKSFIHALEGIKYAIIYEHNMIIILMAIIVVTCFGFYFDLADYEWLFCIVMYGLVMACEMLNTAIEAVVDLETIKIHPLAKLAKDTASSATLICCITALVGAIVIFGPKIYFLIK